MTLNAVEKRVLDSLDLDDMTRFIEELVAIPSYGGRESQAQRHMAEKLRSLGFHVDTWMIDFSELRGHPDYSMSIPREEGMGVVGTLGSGERSLILCGHIDTVDPGDPGTGQQTP